MTRDRTALIVVFLISAGVFLADWYLLPGSSVPAVFYAVPIAIVGFLLAPRLVIGTTVLVLALELVQGMNDQIPLWRLATDMASLAIIGTLGVMLAIRIGQRTALTREIDAERARLAAIVAQMPLGVLVAEAPPGKIVLGNEQIEQIWGRPFQLSPEIARYQDDYPIFHPDGTAYQAEEHPLSRSLLTTKPVVDEEASFRRGDGTIGTLRISSAPIWDPEGRIEAAVATFQDISEHKEEERLREHYVHTISHDLRAPLTIILGHAQILALALGHSQQDGRELRGAQAIVTAAKRMNIMIQDLVDSARSESGQLRLETQPTNLRTYVADLLERAGPLMDTRRVRVEMPANLPHVRADANRLERILVNLIVNALKYSPPEADVVVSAKTSGHEVEIRVTDRGLGIPPQDVPHIFDRFYRAGEGQGAEGLGLGLYITKMLVEAHGGHIWVNSQVGTGSTFGLSLPVVG